MFSNLVLQQTKIKHSFQSILHIRSKTKTTHIFHQRTGSFLTLSRCHKPFRNLHTTGCSPVIFTTTTEKFQWDISSQNKCLWPYLCTKHLQNTKSTTNREQTTVTHRVDAVHMFWTALRGKPFQMQDSATPHVSMDIQELHYLYRLLLPQLICITWSPFSFLSLSLLTVATITANRTHWTTDVPQHTCVIIRHIEEWREVNVM